MGKTEIEWTDSTWNPVTGCTKISPACKNCYAARMANRLRGRAGYPADDPFRVTLHPDRLAEPLRWREPRMVFPVSMGDLFHRDVPDMFIAAAFGIMVLTPHTYQVLTKRVDECVRWFEALDRRANVARDVFPEESLNWRRWHVLRAAAIQFTGKPLPSIPSSDPPWPPPNVWAGATVENQEMADERIEQLRQVPAALRYVSIEPMLGQLDLRLRRREPCSRTCFHHVSHPCEKCGYQAGRLPVDWVIVGGETGPGARPMRAEWVRDVRDQCARSGVPFFFKSWGDWLPVSQQVSGQRLTGSVKQFVDGGELVIRCGKQQAGHLLDGREHRQWPERRAG